MTEHGLSVTIAQGVAEVKGTNVVGLIDNFSRYVDPDALDRLFRVSSPDTHRQGSGHLRLEIEDVTVTVRSNGEIEFQT